MINAGQVVAYLTLDKSSYSAGIKSAYQELTIFLDSSESAGSRIQALGNSMTSVGKMMTKGFTAQIVGAGETVTKFATDYETGLAEVNSLGVNLAQAAGPVISASGKLVTEVGNLVPVVLLWC